MLDNAISAGQRERLERCGTVNEVVLFELCASVESLLMELADQRMCV